MIIYKTDTKPSLFEPLEIEIDGRVFRCREMTLGAIEKIQTLQKAMVAGSAKAIREMLETIIVGDVAPLMALTIPKLQSLMTAIVERVVRPTESEKNESRPADAPSH